MQYITLLMFVSTTHQRISTLFQSPAAMAERFALLFTVTLRVLLLLDCRACMQGAGGEARENGSEHM